MTQLLLRNCTLPGGDKKDVFINDDRIQEIAPQIHSRGAHIDCQGKILIPGIIDVHTHIRDMNLSEKEDWYSASYAAASGGITTVLDMPNTRPATFDAASLEQKRLAAKKSIVNYGYNFGVTENNHDEIRRASPIAALKMFMAESSSGYVVENEQMVRQVFKVAEQINKPLIIHSELQSCVEKHEKQYEPVLRNHNKIRNRECAVNATRLLLKLAAESKAKIYLAHISTSEEIDMIRKAKKNGLDNIFCETTPHYMFIDETILEKVGNYGKVNPPLRTAQDSEAIIEGLRDGTVDTIGTDHAPHQLSEKNKDYPQAPSGFPGLETSLGLIYTLVREAKITLERFVQLMSGNPANIFNIKNRGRIETNAMADLTLVDPDYEWHVDPAHFYTKAKYSPFAGMKLTGKAVITIVNGNIVWQNNNISDIKGREVEFT